MAIELEIIDLHEVEQKQDSRFLEDPNLVTGRVITITNDSGVVSQWVEGRKNFVWVRFETGAVQEVYAGRLINPVVGLPVICRRMIKKPFVWMIDAINESEFFYADVDQDIEASLYRAHANDHVIRDTFIGTDPLLVYTAALATLKITKLSGFIVRVSPHIYIKDNAIVIFPGGQLDLTSNQPVTGLKRYILVYLNKLTNTLAKVIGDTADSSTVGPPFPTVPDDSILAGLVLLYNQSEINVPGDIKDIRQILNTGEAQSALPDLTDVDDELTTTDGALMVYSATNEEWVAADILVDVDGSVMVDGDGKVVFTYL